MSTETKFVSEIPSSLKSLARLVARGFYSLEDALIIDMLVRNPCMKEDDICDLLKFEKKMLRARMALLKNDKFLQVRLKMETTPDGKSQRMNYYYINYKMFVNMVKYKLDHIRRKLETEERDANSRASFKCSNCLKTYTDLEADQLFDFNTGEFRCTYCTNLVEEDVAAVPEMDSRLMLSRFNDQMEPVYRLLHEVEGVQLSSELLEPEPFDINTLQPGKLSREKVQRGEGDGMWSGEATRNTGLDSETSVQINIGGADKTSEASVKERPIWMVESTVRATDEALEQQQATDAIVNPDSRDNADGAEDIMSVLLAVEKTRDTVNSNRMDAIVNHPVEEVAIDDAYDDDVGTMESDDDDEPAPLVEVNGTKIPLTHITDDLIASMTPAEKDAYIQAYQDAYHADDIPD